MASTPSNSRTKIIHTVSEWRGIHAELARQGRSIGFVPTMGALHAGHASLFKRARRENDVVLASVFVNPTQFDQKWDFEHYPRTLESDHALATESGVDYLFVPSVNEMYPNQTRYSVQEKELSQHFCGAHRPGHFEGMLTVVLKLLLIAQATRAYFGEKDFQQYLLIQGMREAFFIPTEIIACPTLRENTGLALSSRNTHLSSSDRARAAQFPIILRQAASPSQAVQALRDFGFEVDYVEDYPSEQNRARRLGAIRIGKVRLIDNVEI